MSIYVSIRRLTSSRRFKSSRRLCTCNAAGAAVRFSTASLLLSQPVANPRSQLKVNLSGWSSKWFESPHWFESPNWILYIYIWMNKYRHIYIYIYIYVYSIFFCAAHIYIYIYIYEIKNIVCILSTRGIRVNSTIEFKSTLQINSTTLHVQRSWRGAKVFDGFAAAEPARCESSKSIKVNWSGWSSKWFESPYGFESPNWVYIYIYIYLHIYKNMNK